MLSEAKAQCRVEPDFSEDNEFLTGLIADARGYVETITGRALITQEYDLMLGGFPCGQIRLPLGSLQSISSFTWTDAAYGVHSWTFTAPNLLDGSTIRAHVENIITPPERTFDEATIILGYNQFWPVEVLKTGHPIRIRFTCGYGDASRVPNELKRAILLLISHWYENRDAVVLGRATAIASAPLATAFDSLITNYRLYS